MATKVPASKRARQSDRGRKRLPRERRLAIVEKLRWLILKRHNGNRSAFARAVGVPYSTITGWFSDDPRVDHEAPAPDTRWLFQIAESEDVNYDWLFGDSEIEFRGAPGAEADWPEQLWRAVILSMRLPKGATKQHAARLLPSGETMLREMGRHYEREFGRWWHHVGDWVKEGTPLDELLLKPTPEYPARRWKD